MKKSLYLILLLACASLLFSCKSDKTDNAGGNTDTGTAIGLICSDSLSEQKATDIYSEIVSALDMNVRLRAPSSNASEHEIIIGKTNRPLSERAYLLLNRIEKEDEDFDNSYIIITDGKSVAVAYDENNFGNTYARDDAIEALIYEILKNNTDMVFEGQVLKKDTVNIVERLEAIDEAKNDVKWAKLTEHLGGDKLAEDTVAAIKKYYELASDDMITWLANLYDPETGGFYFSNSGRNTVGYAPDIESTHQALGLLSSSGAMGAINGNPANIPGWMKEKIVNWLKPMQDTNGLFYHPQWGKELGDSRLSRLGRDLWRAEDLLKWCGAKPTYTTPDGVEGDYTLADGTKVDKDGTPIAASALTERLSASRASLVAKVVANATPTSSSIPSHMKDEKSFVDYLATFDIKHDSYYVGNEIASQGKWISNREAQLRAQNSSWSITQTLEKWLKDNQNPENGLWYFVPKYSPDYSIYDGVNGLLKISALYNEVGIEFPNPEAAIESAIEGIYTDENPLTVCYTYNTWFSVKNIFENLEMFSSNPDETEELISGIRRRLLDDAPNLIEHTRRKVISFMKEDGSFSYYQDKNTYGSMGMPVAVPNINEGDINSTLICANSTGSYMFQVLEIIDLVPYLYSGATWYRFLSIIDDIGDVIKDEVKDDPVITFENYSEGDVPDDVFFDYEYSSGDHAVIKNPDGRGMVYKFDSPSDGGDRLQIDCTNPLSTNSFIYESDLYFEPTCSGYCAQIVLGDCYMLGFRIADGRVHIFDTSSASTIKKEVDFGYSVPVKEWFKLRVEYYPGTEDTVRTKVFVNNKLVAVSDNYYNHSGSKITTGHGTPASIFTFVRISAFSNYNVSILMDNIQLRKANEVYEIETNPDNQPVYTVDPTNIAEVVYDFEKQTAGKHYPPRFEVNEGDDTVRVISDGENKYLSLSGTSGNGFVLDIPHTTRTPDANCDVFETDLILASAEVGAEIEFAFRTSKYDQKSILRILFKVVEENGVKYLVPYTYPNGSLASLIQGIKIEENTKTKLKIEYFAEAKTALIYLDGKLVGSDDAICSTADGNSVGKLQLANKATANFEIRLDNTKLERIARSFSESAKPSEDSKLHDFENGLPEDITVTAGAQVTADKKLLLSSGSSITLPLHERSLVLSTVILSTKLSIPENTEDGSTVLFRLADGAGNASLAFTVKVSGGAAYIHETTSKATYGPLASFTLGEEHTLLIEQHRSKNEVHIYIDGACISVSSLSYSDTSALSGVLTVSSQGVSATIDDLVFESYAKMYAIPEITAPNPENGKDVITLESSSTGSLPSALKISKGTSYKVKEALSGGVYNKILEFITTRGNKNNLTLGLTEENSGYTVTVFETDMLVRHNGNSSEYAFRVNLLDQNDNIAYTFVLRIGDTGMQMWDIHSSGNGETKVIAKRDTWYNIRVEYYYGESGGVRIVTYVNDSIVYDSDRVYNPTSKITSLSFTADEGLNATVLFNNLSLTEKVQDQPNGDSEENETPTPKPEDPIGPVNPDTPDLENTEDKAEKITFESSADNNLPNAVTVGLAGSTSTLKIEELLRAENNKKVMTLTTTKGSKHNDYVALALTKTAETYDATVFETDLYIKHDGGSSSYSFTVTLLDDGGNVAYKFILRIGDAGMQMWDIGESTGQTMVIAKRDTWFTLRVEYLHNEGKVLTYVDGTLKYESGNLTGNAVSKLEKMSFVADEGVNATVKFDNMSLIQTTVNYVAPEEPKPPVEEETGPILTFENGGISSKITSSLSSGTLTVENYKEHNALVLTTVKDSQDSITISPTATDAEGYTVTVFEADMLLYHSPPSTAYNENFAIYDSEGNAVYKFTLRHADAGVYMTAEGQSGSIIASRWVWFNFRLEYRHGTEGANVTVYVNNEVVYESVLASSASKLSSVKIFPDSGLGSKLYLDNLGFYTKIAE